MAADEQTTVHVETYREDPPAETEATRTDNVHEHSDLTGFRAHTESLSRRIRERGGNRSTVTRCIRDVEYAIQNENVNKLRRLKKTLTEKAALLSDLDREIVKVISEDKLEDDIEQSDIVQENIEDALIEIDEALEKLSLPQTQKKPTHRRSHHRGMEESAESSPSSSELSSEEPQQNLTTKSTTTSAVSTLTSTVTSSSTIRLMHSPSPSITSTSTSTVESGPRVSFTGIPSAPPIWTFNPALPFSVSPSPFLFPSTTTTTNAHLSPVTAAPGVPLIARDTSVSTTAAHSFTSSTEMLSEVPPIISSLRPPVSLYGQPLTHPYSTSFCQSLPGYPTSYAPAWPFTDPAVRPRVDPPIDSTVRPRVDPPVHSVVRSSVKLPKLTLRKYNGNPAEWTSFWDSYRSSIHENPELSDIDKFNYLRSTLERNALDAIAGLTNSSANYQQAIDILHKRFGNKQLIISKHMDILLNLHAVQSDNHLRDLRRLYDTTESQVRGLKSLGVEPTTYGALFSSILITKLPPDLRLIISRKIPSSNLDMDSLLETLEQELVARERANPTSIQPVKRERLHNVPHKQHSLFTGHREKDAPTSTSTCVYCQQPHTPANCTSVTKVGDRKQLLKTSGRCFNCLRKNHLSRNCKSTSNCQKCRKRHHTSICDGDNSSVPPTDLSNPNSVPSPVAPPSKSNVTVTNVCSTSSQTVFLQTARATVSNPENTRSARVRLLLDSGSQRSYLSERACTLLNLKPHDEHTLSIATFGSLTGTTRTCPIVTINLKPTGHPPISLELYVVPVICEPLVGQPIATCIETHQHLSRLELADTTDDMPSLPVDLLLGSDYYWQLVTGRVLRWSAGPAAIHTKLGWVISGPSTCDGSKGNSTNCAVTHVLCSGTQPEDPSLNTQLRAFWELESLGIQEKERTLYDDYTNAIHFENGRYKTPLPWKEFHEPLPDHYDLSLTRLRSLLQRLKRNPDILKEYSATIAEQEKLGIIERVRKEEPTPQTIHYLPHHAVIRQNKSTTKLRIVFDASARSPDGPSLNDCLMKGPSFNQLIFDLLLRFRQYKIALVADLEKAFLMVAVKEADRDVLRFLWTPEEHQEPIIYRFTRVVFGVSSSPFLLNATIRFHLEKYLMTNRDLIHKLLRSTYVDDIITGGGSEEEVLEIYSESRRIFREGGFNLRKFLTNSAEVREQIGTEKQAYSLLAREPTYAEATLGVTSSLTVEDHKVLGVPWNPESDQLIFRVAEVAELTVDLDPTKRNLVSLIGRFYDPIGFLTPATVKFKILLQRLCQCKSDWDDEIPTELMREWKAMVTDIRQAPALSLPRCYLTGITEPLISTTLYGFCDASTKAYAAVIYLQLITESQVFVRFVAAKTRVAPIKQQSIPRLELLSALVLSRLMVSVQSSLEHEMPSLSCKCFTDSQVALYWIQGKDKEWKPFVQNRVCEIRRLIPSELWQHCPGSTNPADLPSRGLTMFELSVSQLWCEGPEWLRLNSPPLPDSEMKQACMPEMCQQELKSGYNPTRALLQVTIDESHTIGNLMSCEDYSDLHKLLRVTAYVKRACECFKNHTTLSTPLAPCEITYAEVLWVKHAQNDLAHSKKFATLKWQLGLFLDDKQIWRCRGRLENADTPFAVKYPILLPRRHPLTTLIIRDAHIRVYHGGVKETLTDVRQRFWIVKGRSLVRYILHRCVTCRRHQGAAYTGPPPPPLPTFRLKEDHAFTYTGVDFAGPLVIKDNKKVWICLFTCLVTRAVHLDVVPDQNTGTFIRCLKRFASRRGLPHKFLSDNGKTFKATKKYIDTIFKDNTIVDTLAAQGCQWTFNVEKAPWWGGVFERMVQSTKRCLRKVVGRAVLSLDELTTIVVEIESVLNSRPLTYISSSDHEEALTPSHMLTGRRVLSLPDHLSYFTETEDEDFEINSNQLTKRMKHLSNILNHFWRRWRSEYLSELRMRHRYSAKKPSQSRVEEGDIVIVHDDSLPRSMWRLGRIQKLIAGRDGQVRAATVKVAARGHQFTQLTRPLQMLFPLEISTPYLDLENISDEAPSQDCHVPDPADDISRNSDDNTSLRTSERPRRGAAERAREVWLTRAIQDSTN